MRIFVATFLATYLTCSLAHSEIVLDNFEQMAVTESPLMSNQYVETEDVGELSATRNIRILGSTTDPSGQLEAGGTERPTLTADLETLNPRDNAYIVFQLNYAFDNPVDATESGQNDAILVDFLSASTNDTLLTTRVFVGRANTTVVTPNSANPFTVALPLQDIRTDFTQLNALTFTINTPAPVGGGDFDLHLEIDRIRIGRLVPEPGAFTLLAIAGLIAMNHRSRKLATKRRTIS